MKITVVNGESPRIKYIQLGSERVATVTDCSDNENRSSHEVYWKAETGLNKAVDLIKGLFDEARGYQRPSQDMIMGEPFYRVVALGKKPTADTLNLYPINDFFKHENPVSQITQEVVSVGLLTPHYALHFYDITLREGSPQDKIKQVQFSAYSNVSETIAKLMVETSPAFAAQKNFAEPRLALTQELDQLLSQYQKPGKLN